MSVKLNFGCTNNVTEYKAFIVVLQVALEFGAYDLSIFWDSLLIISQIEGKWHAWDAKLIPYQKCVNRLISKFRNITFAYLPRAHNQFADALATLASMVKLSKGYDMRQSHIEVRGVPAYCMNIEECMNVKVEADEKPWYHDIKAYIKNSEYHSVQRTVKRSSFDAWPANFSWIGKSCRKGTTILPCFDAQMPLRLITWWKKCMKAYLEPMLIDPYWPARLWELDTIGSPWKMISLNMWGHVTLPSISR